MPTQDPSPALANLPRLRRKLVEWFERNARPFPWRRTRSPYAIWVSEIMLQQTQAATAIAYFERFLREFPDLAHLARADEQDVLRLWAGLGYYSRARNLHRAARILMEQHGGDWPTDPKAAGRLPGLGKYTVNAVLSQAFDARLPILEANSRRLLCRLSAEREDPKAKAVENRLWKLAESLLPRNRAGDFNQALMEVGALVCKPERPNCPRCPLRSFCLSHRLGLQDEIPLRAAPKVFERVRELALVIARDDKLLLTQRHPQGRWPNMWEFPHLVWTTDESLHDAALRLLQDLGVDARLDGQCAVLRHGVTRFRITLHCWSAVRAGGDFRPGLYAAARWLRPAHLKDFPLSSPQRRLAELLLQPRLF